NAVAPAVVATPIYERFIPKDQPEQTLHSFDGFHPLGWIGTAWSTSSRSCSPQPPARSLAPSGSSAAASWPDTTSAPGRPCAGLGRLTHGPPAPQLGARDRNRHRPGGLQWL